MGAIVAADGVVVDSAAVVVEDLVDLVAEVQVAVALLADGRKFIGIICIKKAGRILPAFLIGNGGMIIWEQFVSTHSPPILFHQLLSFFLLFFSGKNY